MTVRRSQPGPRPAVPRTQAGGKSGLQAGDAGSCGNCAASPGTACTSPRRSSVYVFPRDQGEDDMQAFRFSAAGLTSLTVRRRRWLIALVVGVVLLALYAGALTWVTQRLQTDIQKSIHPLPAAIEDHRTGG